MIVIGRKVFQQANCKEYSDVIQKRALKKKTKQNNNNNNNKQTTL